MIFLIMWYLVLCFVVMPLDSKLSKWHRRFAPPILTLLYLIGAALFYRPSPSDIEEARAAVTEFRVLPIEWQWIIGIAICLPVLWQMTGAAVEWKAMKRRKRGYND